MYIYQAGHFISYYNKSGYNIDGVIVYASRSMLTLRNCNVAKLKMVRLLKNVRLQKNFKIKKTFYLKGCNG